jgi:hypothetical protein
VICEESGKMMCACGKEAIVHKHERQTKSIYPFFLIGCKST